MSIKGTCWQELYVGKNESNLITGFGNKINIPYNDLKQINYAFAKRGENGYIDFITQFHSTIRFSFTKKVNSKIKKTIYLIKDNQPSLYIIEKDLESLKLYERNWFIMLLLFVCCFPVGLFLLWYNKKGTRGSRIILTTTAVALWITGLALYYKTVTDFFCNEVQSAYNDIMASTYNAANAFIPETENTYETTTFIKTETDLASETEAYSTTLTAGHYIVGVDIPEGTYDFFSKKGSGNLFSDDGTLNEIFTADDSLTQKHLEELGISDTWSQDELHNISLATGTIVSVTGTQQISAGCSDANISGMEEREKDDTLPIELGYGLYAAGDDFPAGTYDVIWIEGNGNIMTEPYEMDYGINEIMGDPSADGNNELLQSLNEITEALYIKQYTNLILKENDILSIKDIKIKLIPK